MRLLDELISKEKVLKIMCKGCCWNKNNNCTLEKDRKCIDVDEVRALPSEVVRCKDCVYWKYRANYKGDEWGACLFLEDVEHWTEETDFCSYGERSEE